MVLGAFAGIRSTEIVGDPEAPLRPRLTWEDFRCEKGYIVVPAMTARRTRRSRRVPLRENLRAWLAPWREARGYLYPSGADQSKETARFAELGLEWDNNVLRHSYATHRNAEIGNAGQLAEEMGNSIQMVRRHYDAVPRDVEPEDYFGLLPPSGWGALVSPPVGQNPHRWGMEDSGACPSLARRQFEPRRTKFAGDLSGAGQISCKPLRV